MTEMVVFDMAGTTVNEDNVVYKTLQKAINQAGYEVSLPEVFLLGAGKEKWQAIKDILNHIHNEQDVEEEASAIFEQFKPMLQDAYETLELSTFEGTEELFDYLHQKGIKVVLNTGYNKSTALKLLSKLNWQEGKQYDLLVTADDVVQGRPQPDMILLAMEKLQLTNPASIVKVGDTAIDIEEGKAAGCGLSLGVTTGAQTREQLQAANPDYIIDSLSFLRELI